MTPLASVGFLGSLPAVLAAGSPTPTPVGNPGDNPQNIGPGPIAFWTVVLLGVGLFFLVRSMGKQMRKVDFDDGSGDDSAEPVDAGRPGAVAGPAPEPGPDEPPRAPHGSTRSRRRR